VLVRPGPAACVVVLRPRAALPFAVGAPRRGGSRERVGLSRHHYVDRQAGRQAATRSKMVEHGIAARDMGRKHGPWHR
jgi:hypothetical protein